MHCDMLKIQDGGAIVEKVNFIFVFPFLPFCCDNSDRAGVQSQHCCHFMRMLPVEIYFNRAS